jgi:hypothetical protein
MNKMGQPRVVQRASFLSFPLLIFVADQDDNTERKKITKIVQLKYLKHSLFFSSSSIRLKNIRMKFFIFVKKKMREYKKSKFVTKKIQIGL